MPARTPAPSPSHGEPVTRLPSIAKKAPHNIVPSRPMLITPDFCETVSPIAASAVGVANWRTISHSKLGGLLSNGPPRENGLQADEAQHRDRLDHVDNRRGCRRE